VPLRGTDARKLLRRVLSEGNTRFTKHARIELKKDDLSDVDAVNLMRGGHVDEAEFENGGWRYRVRTQRMFLTVEFEPEQDALPAEGENVASVTIVVVTASRV
jgi:hypothetical protein